MAESVFGSDEILWYNPPGMPWGELGYACPNCGNDTHTLNRTIAYLVSVLGANLQAVMHHVDASMRVPPSVNTLMRVHKLIVRGREILAGRAVAPGVPNMEAIHATPGKKVFLLFPTPYFRVRSPWLQDYAELVLTALTEAMQHTENRKDIEISTSFAGLIGQYLQRIYVRLATELLHLPLAEAQRPDYTIPDTAFAAYDPSKWFTATELVDTVPALRRIPTEDDLAVLREGIPANVIVGLMGWPTGDNIGGTGGAAASTMPTTAAFVAPPSP